MGVIELNVSAIPETSVEREGGGGVMEFIRASVNVIEFSVDGIAKPAGSKRAFGFKRKNGSIGVSVTDDCAKTKNWQGTVSYAASQAYSGPLLAEALRVHFQFRVVRPKCHFNKRGLKLDAPKHPAKRPDCLKLSRAVEDALTGVLWTDDSLIVDERITKVFAERSGVDVLIEQM